MFLYAYKRGIHAVQLFNERCEFPDISADTVKLISVAYRACFYIFKYITDFTDFAVLY